MVPVGSEGGGNLLSQSATPFVPLTGLTWVSSIYFLQRMPSKFVKEKTKTGVPTNCVRQLCPDIHLLVQYYCYQGQERTIYSHQQSCDFYLTHK